MRSLQVTEQPENYSAWWIIQC